MDKKSIIFLVIGLLIFAIMLYFIGIDNVISAFKLAKYEYVLLAIIIQVFTYFLYTFRWKLINNLANINVNIKKLIPMVLVSLAVNNITPSGRGGGEPVRAYILAKQENYLVEETFATVVADRALDTFPFVILAILTIISMTFRMDFPTWLLILMIVAVIVIVLILILLIYMSINPNFGRRVEGWIMGVFKLFYKKNLDKMEEKIHMIVTGFQDTMKLVLSDKKILYQAVPLSFLIWIFEIVRVYIVFLAFGVNVDLFVIGEVFIIASLVGMIPFLPGGIGAVDGIMILFFSTVGIPYSISAAASLIERVISFWMTTVIGLMILPYYGASVLDKISFSHFSDKDD